MAGRPVTINANGSMNEPVGAQGTCSRNKVDVEIRKEVNAVSQWSYNEMVGKAQATG